MKKIAIFLLAGLLSLSTLLLWQIAMENAKTKPNVLNAKRKKPKILKHTNALKSV